MPSLVLHTEVAPSPVSVGDTVAFTITVVNQANDPALDLRIALPVPAGAVPAGSTSEQQVRWTWSLPRLEGRASRSVTGQLRLASQPVGNALLLHVSAMAEGLAAPVEQRGGAVVLDRAQPAGIARFTPGQPAQLRSHDGRVTVNFPGTTLASGLDLTARPLELAAADPRMRGTPPPPALAGWKRTLAAVVLEARDDQQRDVHQFDAPVTLRMAYTLEELEAAGIGEQNLTIYWFDLELGEWVDLGGQVDPASRTVTLSVDHFSTYALGDGSSPSAAFIPSLQGWQVGLQTGAANYSFPIEVPAGPGGLKPNLSLSYNSGASDGPGAYHKLQAGWVGRGWSFDTGSIARNTVKVSGTDNRSYFSLVLNGASYSVVKSELLPGYTDQNDPDITHWRWRASNDAFLKMRVLFLANSTSSRGGYYNTSTPYARYRWLIWTKDGTRYEFDEDVWRGWDNCGAGNGASMETYKWLLSKVVDTHRNVMTYTYNRDSVTGSNLCGGVHGVIDRDIWPATIIWGRNSLDSGSTERYRVTFETAARSYDTDYDFATNQYGGVNGAPRETRQLSQIKVESKQSSSWELVRRYDLTYEANSTSNTNLLYSDRSLVSGSDWVRDTAYPKLTLESITRVGKDGSTVLPTTSFYYGTTRGTGEYANAGWNRLIKADNGQGGTVRFEYEHIAPVFSGQTWRNLFKDHHRVINKVITTAPTNLSYSQTYTWTYVYDNTNGRPNYNNLGTTLEPGTWSTQSVANSAALYINEYTDTMHDNSAWLLTKPNKEYRGHPYVKEIAPDGAQTEHWYYMGDIADDGCSITYLSSNIPNDPCFQKLRNREFLKGKEYRTRYRGPSSAGSPLLKQLNHTFAVDFYAYSYGVLTGLWRAFSYESEQAEGIWEGTTTPLTTTTKYFYTPTGYQDGDQQLGNLTRTEVYRGSETPAYRVTKSYYATRNIDEDVSAGVTGSYIVDRAWMRRVEDGSGNLLSLTHNFYDGNNTAVKTLGVTGSLQAGRLTRTAKYFDVPASDTNATLHGVDTTYTYDTYGNQTGVTTYVGPGTRLYNGTSYTISAAGGGSATSTTTTTFDSTFHAFSTQTDMPVGDGTPLTEKAEYDYRMGTLIKVVGPNGDAGTPINCTNVFNSANAAYTTVFTAEVQCASYDVFGRMAAVVKPGDTGQYPSLVVTYHDTEQPFRYTYEQRPTAGTGTTRIFQQFYDGMGQLLQTKAESQDGTENSIVDKRYDGLGHVVEESQPRALSQSGSAFTSYTAPTAGQPLNNPTTTQYDALGRVRLTTAPDASKTEHLYGLTTISGLGLVKTVDTIDANRHRTTQWSDGFDRLLGVQEWSGDCGTLTGALRDYSCGTSYTSWAAYAETSYAYDRLDQLTGVTDDGGNQTLMVYDSLGRKLSMSDPDMGQWRYRYDLTGNMVEQIDAKQQSLFFEYDAIDRLSARRGLSERWADLFSDTTMTSWSTAGSVSESGGAVTLTGNGSNFNTSIIRSAAVPAETQGISLTFRVSDAAGENELLYLESGTVGQSSYRRWGLLVSGGLLKLQTYAGTTETTSALMAASANTWYRARLYVNSGHQFSIDVEERDTSGVRASAQERHASWSGLSWSFVAQLKSGTLTLDAYAETQGQEQADYRYDETTNGKGKLTTSKNANLTKSIQYDTRGRTSQVTYSNIPGLTDQGGSVLSSRVFNWSYDNGDNITELTYPARLSTDTREKVKYTYDFVSRPATLVGDRNNDATFEVSYISSAAYTVLDQPSTWSFGNGVVQTWSYSSVLKQLDRLQVGVSGTPGRDFDRSYAYNLVGNITGITDNKASGNSQAFTYDQRDRLESWTLGANPAKTYGYNTIGNLTSKEGTSYSYGSQSAGCADGALNKPHAVVTVGVNSYCYDKNGNILSGAARSYSWTRENLTATITGADAVQESYAYNAENGRIKKTRSGVSTFYLEGLWEETTSGATKSFYPFNKKTVAERSSSTGLAYIHGDHLGSVSLTTSSAGVASTIQEFDPWGTVRSGALQTVLNFTNQRLDATGLLYYNARMYDPALGRFMSPDTIIPKVTAFAGAGAQVEADNTRAHSTLTVDYHEQDFLVALNQEQQFRLEHGFRFEQDEQERGKAKNQWGPQNPQALNRYAYVLNNPVRYTDPSGHQCQGGGGAGNCTAMQSPTLSPTAFNAFMRDHFRGANPTSFALWQRGVGGAPIGAGMLGGAGAVAVGIGIGVTHVLEAKKKSRTNREDRSTNYPNWVKEEYSDLIAKLRAAGKKGKEIAKEIFEDKYPDGYPTGGESEYQRTQKALDRGGL